MAKPASDLPDCEEVCLANATALMASGEVLAITNWFDDDGDDCDREYAVSCVAGPDRHGYWYTIDLSHFERGATH